VNVAISTRVSSAGNRSNLDSQAERLVSMGNDEPKA
jgi:predicted site-specific integrase-resolvase